MGSDADDFASRFARLFGPPAAQRPSLESLLGNLGQSSASARREKEMTRFVVDEFNNKAMARAVEADITPLDFVTAMATAPPVPRSHPAHKISAASMVEAGLVLGCRIELTFVPIEPSKAQKSVEDELANFLSSLFSQPCDDPTCGCHAEDGSAVKIFGDPSRSTTNVFNNITEAPPSEGSPEEETADDDRATSLAGADGHLEAAYEERTEVEG